MDSGKMHIMEFGKSMYEIFPYNRFSIFLRPTSKYFLFVVDNYIAFKIMTGVSASEESPQYNAQIISTQYLPYQVWFE